MKRYFIATAVLLCLMAQENSYAYSYNATKGHDTIVKFSIGGGLALSTINMRMEPIGELKSGWNARASLRFMRRMGVTAEYTHQKLHFADPAWINIKAHNIDLNMTFLYFNVGVTNTNFYTLVGACYQQWNGEYKGPAAVNSDNDDYKVGDLKTFNWTSFNAGLGFERNYNHLGLFGEFKFRFGKNNPPDPFGIVDVCITLGAKINLSVSDLHRKSKNMNDDENASNDSSKPGLKTPAKKKFKIAPRIYHWF